VILWLLLISGGICPAYGQAGLIFQRPRLTGSWGGFRNELAKNGISVTSTFIGDGMANVQGGLQRKVVFMDNWDLGLSVNANRLLGWQGGRIRFSILQNNGAQPSKYIGDVQTANNIEAVRTFRIYEAWIQQNLLNNRLSLLAGVYDINFEFDYMESASLFLNSSQGIGGAIAASGLAGPPTFPATTPTIRLKVMPTSSFYAQAAVSDGAPGVKHVSWYPQENNGTFWITEAGFLTLGDQSELKGVDNRNHISCGVNANYLYKLAIGGWMYSRNFVKQRLGVAVPSGKNEKGFYLFFDLRSFAGLWESLDSLAWHAQLGVADNSLSRMHLFWNTGITYQNFPWDADGVAGFSVSAVQNSKVYNELYSGKHPNYEVALEWTYRTAVTSWLNIQPDIQQIINPGMAPKVKNALVLGLQTEFRL
jgi:porin